MTNVFLDRPTPSAAHSVGMPPAGRQTQAGLTEARSISAFTPLGTPTSSSLPSTVRDCRFAEKCDAPTRSRMTFTPGAGLGPPGIAWKGHAMCSLADAHALENEGSPPRPKEYVKEQQGRNTTGPGLECDHMPVWRSGNECAAKQHSCKKAIMPCNERSRCI